MIILDASAVLAFLQDEAGAHVVEQHIENAVIGATNWSEVAQKLTSRGADFALADQVLASYGIHIEPVTKQDAETAAHLWRPSSGLSLADRLCLALSERLDAPVLTADKAWGESDRIVQIR